MRVSGLHSFWNLVVRAIKLSQSLYNATKISAPATGLVAFFRLVRQVNKMHFEFWPAKAEFGGHLFKLIHRHAVLFFQRSIGFFSDRGGLVYPGFSFSFWHRSFLLKKIPCFSRVVEPYTIGAGKGIQVWFLLTGIIWRSSYQVRRITSAATTFILIFWMISGNCHYLRMLVYG